MDGYSVFYQKPHPLSFAAYLQEGFRIVVLDHSPSWWQTLPSIDEQPTERRFWYVRYEATFKAYDDCLRTTALKDFEAAGINVPGPLSPELETLLHKLMSGFRASGALQQLLIDLDGGVPDLLYLPAQAIAGFCTTVPRGELKARPFHVAVAELLNDGIPLKDKSNGLEWKHVRSADDRWSRDLLAVVNRTIRARRNREIADAVLMANFNATHSLARNLTYLYWQARAHDRFRGIKGAELARAIHADPSGDLFVRLDRADAEYRRRVDDAIKRGLLAAA